MQINEYVNGLYRKVKEEEESRVNGQLQKRLQTYDEQFVAIADRFDQTDKMHEAFEDKTEANFKIAEQMLLAHSNCINQLDGRLMTEELFARVTLDNLEQRTSEEFANLAAQVDISNKDLFEKLSVKITTLRHAVEDDMIPTAVLQIREFFEGVKSKIVEDYEGMRVFYAERFGEQEQKLNAQGDTLDIHAQKIKFNEDNIDVVTEVLQKHTKRIGDNEMEAERSREQLTSVWENRFQMIISQQKQSEKTLTDSMQAQYKTLSNSIEDLKQAQVRPDQMQDIRTAVSRDITESIRTTVPAMIDNQTRAIVQQDVMKMIDNDVAKMVKQESSRITDQVIPRMLDDRTQQITGQTYKMIEDQVPNLIQKQVPGLVDAKVAELQSRNSQIITSVQQDQKKQEEFFTAALDKKADKTDITGIAQQVKFADDKHISDNTLATQKIQNLEEKLSALDKRVNQDHVADAKLNDEIRQELNRLQQVIDQITNEQRDKDRQNQAINSKLDDLAGNMKGFQDQMKDQAQKTASQQGDTQKEVVNQLQRLYDQFNALQKSIQGGNGGQLQGGNGGQFQGNGGQAQGGAGNQGASGSNQGQK